jgi:hypothetical protein
MKNSNYDYSNYPLRIFLCFRLKWEFVKIWTGENLKEVIQTHNSKFYKSD